MFLDNWLSQRAQACPERCALIADGTSLTYAELEREATAAARRLAARGARRDGTRGDHTGSGGRVHRRPACADEARRRGAPDQHPAQPRGDRGRDRACPARTSRSAPRPTWVRPRPTCRCSASTTSRRSTADCSRRAPREPRASVGPHVRQPPVQRRRLGVQHRRRADRPLALLPAAVSRRRALNRDAQRDPGDHRRCPRSL